MMYMYKVTDLINALPDNSLVNTNTRNSKEGGVFSVPCRAASRRARCYAVLQLINTQ
jgi:hypothetical protein